LLPLKTTIEDFDTLSSYLASQVGWVPLDRVRKTLEGKYSDVRKLEAQKRVGFIERDGTNIKLSERGRTYAAATDPSVRAELMSDALREVPLYVETVEWLHYSKVKDPTRTVIGNYWHDKHGSQLEGAKGAALTDAAIFFMRLAGAAGLGKFTRGSGKNPDSYLKSDPAAVEKFVTTRRADVEQSNIKTDDIDPSAATLEDAEGPSVSNKQTAAGPPPVAINPQPSVTTSPAIHVNLEIHIAADATAETVAEIFKNMRKYVLNNPDDVESS
jgi:hypothetical protein